MSQYPNDFITFAHTWASDRNWPHYHPTSFTNSTLDPADVSPEGFTFNASTGEIEFTLAGHYLVKDSNIVNASIKISVPSWGHIDIAEGRTFSVDHPTQIKITGIPQITGEITLRQETDQGDIVVVTVNYDINTPYGRFNDHASLFPTDPSHLNSQTYDISPPDHSLIERWRLTPHSPGHLVGDGDDKYWKFEDLGVLRVENEVQLLGKFLDNYVVKNSDGLGIALPAYSKSNPTAQGRYPTSNQITESKIVRSRTFLRGSVLIKFLNYALANLGIAAPTDRISTTNEKHVTSDQPAQAKLAGDGSYSLDQTFLGIFGVTGTIEAAELGVKASVWVKAPFVGKVTLVSLEGSLRTGVTGSINVAVASGSITLSVKPDGGKNTLYVRGEIKVALVGTKSFGDTKLITLPF